MQCVVYNMCTVINTKITKIINHYFQIQREYYERKGRKERKTQAFKRVCLAHTNYGPAHQLYAEVYNEYLKKYPEEDND